MPLQSIGLVALACVAILGLQCWWEWAARSAEIGETETFLVNLASSLSQHAEDTIEVADTAVNGLVKRLESDGTSAATLAQLDGELVAHISERSRYWALIVTDANGEWLASSSPAKGINPSDRVFFRHHRDDPDRGPFVGPPIRNRVSGTWSLTVTRRYQSASGAFAGVVIAIIDLSYFAKHYATYDLGPGSAISLSETDATLLARFPEKAEFIGRAVPGAEVFSQLRQHNAGSYTNTAIIDGTRRFTGYCRGERYPLVVVAGMSEEYALRDWRTGMHFHLLIASVLTCAIGLLGLHLIRQMQASQDDQQRLRDSEVRYRSQAETLRKANERVLLATDSGAIALWELNVTTQDMTWDAWMFRLFGILHQSAAPTYALWEKHVHPEDRVAAKRAVDDCVQRDSRYYNEFRVVWDDGAIHHLRSSGRKATDAGGTIVRLIGATWDVTAERVQEDQRRTIIEAAQGRIDYLEELQAIFHTMVDGLVIVDEAGLIKTYTPAAERLFGYFAHEVLGQNFRMLRPDPDQADHDDILALCCAAGDNTVVEAGREIVAKRKDGTTFPAELGISAYRFSEEKRFVIIVRDVTTRKQIEAALKLREASLQLAWRGTGIGMWDWDIVTGELVFSDRFKELLGFAPDEFPHRFDSLDVRMHPEDKETTYRILQAHLAEQSPYATEYRLMTKAGEWRWFSVCGQAMWNEAGNAVRMAGSLADITESKRQQQALRTSEETVRSALEAAAVGMALVATTGHWMMVNPALCDLLGYDAADLLHSDFQSLIWSDDLDRCLEMIGQVLAGQTTLFRIETRFEHKTGRVIWVLLSGSLVRDLAGQANYFVWQLHDMTERKQMEIMQDEFVSTVNHELRTPLSSIYGSIRLLRAKNASQLDARGSRLLELAEQSCSRLTSLVNDILDLEKISAGKMDYVMEKLELGQVVLDIVERHLSLAESYGILFVTKLNVGAVIVNIDPDRFSQSLVNLLSNAAKYSPKDATVTIAVDDATAGWVRVSVTDHGSGIPKAFRHKVFGRFAQADSSATRKVGGSGLGLNITKRIIEAFGGTVTFDSAEGQGTTFYFHLPIQPADAKAA